MVRQSQGEPQEAVDTSTGEIVPTDKRPFSDAELRNVDSLEGIRSLLGEDVAQSTDLGSGFAVLESNEDKARLVGVPTLFLFWQFHESKTIRNQHGAPAEFVSAHVVTLDKAGQVTGKFIVNDGSTGIYRQLADLYMDSGRLKGLFAPKGLRRSEYDTEVNGQMVHGVTFYVDMTPEA